MDVYNAILEGRIETVAAEYHHIPPNVNVLLVTLNWIPIVYPSVSALRDPNPDVDWLNKVKLVIVNYPESNTGLRGCSRYSVLLSDKNTEP